MHKCPKLLGLLMILFVNARAQSSKVAVLPPVMDEISGIAIASGKKIMAFMHNDSGDTSRIFAMGKNGKLLSTLYFKGVTGSKGVADCEDIASGKSPGKKGKFIYLGDIGDNKARRPFIAVYRIAEPQKVESPVIEVAAEVVFLHYPDGARDAETLMVDNTDELLYIISKREDTVSIYTAPLAWKNGDTITLQKRGTRWFPGERPAKWICSGDISADGKKVVLKNYLKIYYWDRKKKEPVWETLQRPAIELPYDPEPQGEAVCFDNKGKGYYTVSEGKEQPVYYYLLNTGRKE